MHVRVALLGVALASSVSFSFCNQPDDSKKSSTSDDESSDKSDKKKKKKSGDDDDDDDKKSKCTAKFDEAKKDQKDNAFDYKCPADCDPKAATIWGTGWYTGDSSVCIAAIHSGAIKASKGGKVASNGNPPSNSKPPSGSIGWHMPLPV